MGKPTKHRGVLPKNAPAGTIVERTIINRGNRRKIKWKRTRPGGKNKNLKWKIISNKPA